VQLRVPLSSASLVRRSAFRASNHIQAGEWADTPALPTPSSDSSCSAGSARYRRRRSVLGREFGSEPVRLLSLSVSLSPGLRLLSPARYALSVLYLRRQVCKRVIAESLATRRMVTSRVTPGSPEPSTSRPNVDDIETHQVLYPHVQEELVARSVSPSSIPSSAR